MKATTFEANDYI